MDGKNIVYGIEPTVPVFNGTAGRQMYEALLKYRHKEKALVMAETQQIFSYSKILTESCRLAQAFRKCGFTQNDIVAIYSENCMEYLVIVIACWYLGMAAAPINFSYIKHELYRVVSISKPSIIFCTAANLQKIKELQKKLGYIKKVILIDSDEHNERAESMKSFVFCNSESAIDVVKFVPADFDVAQQVALVLCSSGTTGFPKGVMITHQNLIYRFTHCMEPEFQYDKNIPDLTLLMTAPMFHAMGVLGIFEPLLLGYCVIFMKAFDPNLYLRCIEDYKVKRIIIPPTIAVFLAKSALVKSYKLSSLEDILCGAAPLSKETQKSLNARLGTAVRQGYGLTEATFAVIISPKHKIKDGSVGIVVPHVMVKVVDIETNKTLEAKKPGEIWVKGPLLTKGYMNDIESTRNVFMPNGWLATGDIGYYDEDGYFYIIDRLKELIKYKGFQVAPSELEAVLLEHSKIADAGVCGLPDEVAGELPAAFITVRPGHQLTQQEVLEYMKCEVSPQKQLRGGVYFIDAIPRNSSGKILRRELRELLKQKFSKL